MLDARNTGSNAVLFVVTPAQHAVRLDHDDSSNEDSSPDFFWDSATKITERGWTLEIRIPFSSIRYKNVDPQTWRIMLYRNYPRDFHYQFFSMRHSARQQLLRVPRERADGPREAPGRRSHRRRAVRRREQRGRAPGPARIAARETRSCTRRSAWT